MNLLVRLTTAKETTMELTQHLKTLHKIADQLKGGSINWVLTGSLALALQGLSVEVHDIDIQTEKDGAYEFERRFAENVIEPVRFSETERIRSHYGKFEIDGLKVEIMGDLQKRLDDQEWEEFVDIAVLRHWIKANNQQVPVLPLEYEYQAYLKLGRMEKAELIRTWLQKENQEH